MKAASTLLVEINIRKTDVLHRYPELSQTSFPPLPPPLSTAANEAEANEEVRLFVQRVRFGKLGAPKSGSAAGFVNQRRARRIDLGDLLWCLMLEVSVFGLRARLGLLVADGDVSRRVGSSCSASTS